VYNRSTENGFSVDVVAHAWEGNSYATR